MAKVISKKIMVEFDQKDVNNLFLAIDSLGNIIANLDFEAELGEEIFSDPKGLIEHYTKELKRVSKCLETVLPTEIQTL